MGSLDFINEADVKCSRSIHRLQLGIMEYILVFFGFIFNQYLIWLVPFYIYKSCFDNNVPNEIIVRIDSSKQEETQVAAVMIIFYLVSVVFTVISTQSCKKIFGRVRPSMVNMNQKFNLRKLEGNCSMPSGDTAQAANWSVFMAVNFCIENSFNQYLFLHAWVPIAFARIYFQCHWVSDTVVGAAIGIGVASFCDLFKESIIQIIISTLDLLY
ncbi:unnamed protein product [Moneuplotes crassus]|uniref:Phosphatidic acid phosphatase type 2/haloperoxidase domain-containing protein n=1 Tax=Euplotes crassus TaxID=5936 RepID=A0AAD1XWW5_EUPCR|nr:unnamed protein product [Moneuplotes crassus]